MLLSTLVDPGKERLVRFVHAPHERALPLVHPVDQVDDVNEHDVGRIVVDLSMQELLGRITRTGLRQRGQIQRSKERPARMRDAAGMANPALILEGLVVAAETVADQHRVVPPGGELLEVVCCAPLHERVEGELFSSPRCGGNPEDDGVCCPVLSFVGLDALSFALQHDLEGGFVRDDRIRSGLGVLHVLLEEDAPDAFRTDPGRGTAFNVLGGDLKFIAEDQPFCRGESHAAAVHPHRRQHERRGRLRAGAQRIVDGAVLRTVRERGAAGLAVKDGHLIGVLGEQALQSAQEVSAERLEGSDLHEMLKTAAVRTHPAGTRKRGVLFAQRFGDRFPAAKIGLGFNYSLGRSFRLRSLGQALAEEALLIGFVRSRVRGQFRDVERRLIVAFDAEVEVLDLFLGLFGLFMHRVG